MFDIQLFAEEGDAPAEEPAQVEDPEDEVQAKIDAAITKIQAQFDAQIKKLETQKKEAERLSKLSDEERQKAELETAHKELDAQKAEFERTKLKYETAQVLSKRGVPVEFVDYLIAEDSEKTLERIKTFEKKYNAAIEAAVNEKLKGTAPKVSGKSIDEGASKGILDVIKRNQIKR